MVAGALSALGAASAAAAPPSPSNPAGKMLGIVKPHGKASSLSGGGNLLYHNGPVMQTNTTHAIYWVPPGYSVSANYELLINRFFSDVATAKNSRSNVYFSDTQYYGLSGNISDNSTFAGAVVDTDPFPASGCRDSYTSVCLTDAQLQTEIQKVVKATKGWTGGTSNVYFMFTPENVGSCSGSQCSYSYYCAYHSWIGSGYNAILYANMPYAAFVPAACGSGQSPNHDDADSTINVLSHEHNESITDPLGSAWYDRRGNEDGDKCAWTFGTPLGSTAWGQFNQVINGDNYYLQQEWSNHSSGCVLQGT